MIPLKIAADNNGDEYQDFECDLCALVMRFQNV
jgi:hypothetical protein